MYIGLTLCNLKPQVHCGTSRKCRVQPANTEVKEATQKSSVLKLLSNKGR